MTIFRELEWQLAGRVKSALIVMLVLLLMLCGADTWNGITGNVSGESAGRAADSSALATSGQAAGLDNPIDRFFLGVEASMPESVRERWQLLYLDAWEAELTHAYGLMKEELPENFFRENGYGQRAMQAFDTFSEAQGYLEDYYVNDILSSGGQESELTVAGVRLELIRAQTLRLYGEISDRGTTELRLSEEGQLEKGQGDLEDLYLFSESEAMRMMGLAYK